MAANVPKIMYTEASQEFVCHFVEKQIHYEHDPVYSCFSLLSSALYKSTIDTDIIWERHSNWGSLWLSLWCTHTHLMGLCLGLPG